MRFRSPDSRPPYAFRTRSRRRSLRRPAGAVLAALGLGLLFAAPGGARGLYPLGAARGGDPTWSVALHMHASLSEGTGAMEWHYDLAESYGLDAIWWTDHDWRVAMTKHTRRFDFESATLDPGSLYLTEPDDAFDGQFRNFERVIFGNASRTVALVDSLAYEGARSMRLRVWDPTASPDFRDFTYTQVGTRRQNMYSLASRLHLKFALFPESLDPIDARFVVELRMSDHPADTHRLRYVIGSMDGEPTGSISLPYTSGQWNTYDLDLAADAIQAFTSGGADSIRAEDNSLYEIMLVMEVRNSANAIVFFDDLAYDPDPSLDGQDMLDWARAAGSYYESIYPSVTQFIGTEISLFSAQPHMNGFAPSIQLVDYSGHSHLDPLTYAVDQIHAQGGAVSLNHMFGVGIYGDLNETEENKQARILTMKNQLLALAVYGVDILEIGYRWRHGINLAGHIDVWDALVGNGYFLTGNGVSDSHGAVPFHGWGPQIPGDPHRENNFVTWFHAPTLTEVDLVAAMKAGRAYFGDPYEFGWNSEIDLTSTDGFPMGRVVVTDRSSHDVVVEVDGLPSGADVRFRQGEIRIDPPVAYRDVNWLRDEILPAAAGPLLVDTLTVDTSLPSFARIEVIASSGDAIAFSNPIHFLDAVPPTGIPAPRVAARLGDIRILGAEELTLRDATWSASPPALVLALDETTVGAGTMAIECALLGAPTTVTGVGSWDFAGGTLTLDGFSGPGSSVAIGWGAVGASSLESAPREVSLAPGRPNPFGRGLTAEFALPNPALATLEILDVSGRRVRILVDRRFEAGVHRIEWDGNDPYGRPVANGVYFLRLRAGGSSLTSKAVKLR